ncbi:HAMP domain-containing sensor histidine kinase [Rhizobium sp. L1K21]|uniref:sensor histidine kinase n=1 Tax=Rhizobium sp. L1K21 TaxID=2954933 RepID=UPI00209248A2|nr:ATP-binding protein [Rhizobium sp. L1K21]MCO6186668.1 HAMP domain-containing histidine kinase [Rhizobium sp. L1K21]
MSHLRVLLKNTAVRLSALYILLFALCAAVLVFYVGGLFESFLRDQARSAVMQESSDVEGIYAKRGMEGLLATLEQRSRQPGTNIYIIASPQGDILAGNVLSIQKGILDQTGWIDTPFKYQRFTEERTEDMHYALARAIVLPNGLHVLVGTDLGDPRRLGALIRQALLLALGVMGIGAVVIWFGVGRNALKRISRMSEASGRILAGDLSQRLPVVGSGDDFDKLSGSLNTMLARIEKLNEGLKQVSDNIAHDLKTPLTRLRNKASDALTKVEKPAEAREALEGIIGEADQLIRTFNALLMISRVEAGSAAAEIAEVNLSAIVADGAELYELVAEEAGLELSADIAPDLRIDGNRELVGQALFNLIDNAIKYTSGEGTRVWVTLSRQDDMAVLSVSDDGNGIPEDKYEDAVRRFVRLDESRSKPGTGLGLSMVSAVAELHGGRLELSASNTEGSERRGLKASLILPLAKV